MRVCFESVERMDGELARLARGAGKLRHAIGAGLEALARKGGHHELGFSSVEAYALERCERSSRWVQQSRRLARRLAELPALREALISGRIGYSMAQVLEKVAHPEDEAAWLVEARGHTVRQMQVIVKERLRPSEHAEADVCARDGQLRTLTVTVNREDAWLFECARMIARQVAGPTTEETLEALLGEGTTSLLESVSREDAALLEDSASDDHQRRWEAQLARWRDEAEERCEARFAMSAAPAGSAEGGTPDVELGLEFDGDATAVDVELGFTFDGGAAAIDGELRRVASELVVRDLDIGRLAESFWRADGWRRLGYATETQYARERLGTSLSSIETKRRLARRVQALPRLGEAIRRGELGYEAARLVAWVATLPTEESWVERALERTVKHLREEVDAAEMLARLSGTGALAWPPSEEAMQELAALESHVVSGATFREGGQLSAVVASTGRGQLSAPPALSRGALSDRVRGRVTLRLRVSDGTRAYYRRVERLFDRRGLRHVSFLAFLSGGLIESWKGALGAPVAYAQLYARDRYRCTSPVCSRRDVTPHHLQLRSAGGDDSMENLTSLCVWCHLEGIHGGRLRAAPPASELIWSLGRRGNEHTRVHGRRRVSAAVRPAATGRPARAA